MNKIGPITIQEAFEVMPTFPIPNHKTHSCRHDFSNFTVTSSSLGTSTGRFSPGNVRYKNGTTWEKINPVFQDQGSVWVLTGAPYKVTIPKALSKTSFIVWERLKHTIGICPKHTGTKRGVQIADNYIRFENLFGEGRHMEFIATPNKFKKEIVLDAPPDPMTNLSFMFDVNLEGLVDVTEPDEHALAFLQENGDGSFFLNPSIWDADGNAQEIAVNFSMVGEQLRYTKTAPASFLASATYPVRLDYVYTYDTFSAGDGYIARGYVVTTYDTWPEILAATSGSASNYTGQDIPFEIDGRSGQLMCTRGVFPIDTSTLPIELHCTGGTFYLYIDSMDAQFGTGMTVVLTRADQDLSTTTRALGEFDQCEFYPAGAYPTGELDPCRLLTTPVEITPSDEGSYVGLPLTDDGRAYINQFGYTIFALREYHYDVLEGTPPTDDWARFYCATSEDGTGPPYLELDFTTPWYTPNDAINFIMQVNNGSTTTAVGMTTYLPIESVGSTTGSGFTLSGGSDPALCVNTDSTSSYIRYDGTSDYGHTFVPVSSGGNNNPSVTAVGVVMRARNTPSQTGNIYAHLRRSGSGYNHADTTNALSGDSWQYIYQEWATDPAGGDWVPGDLHGDGNTSDDARIEYGLRGDDYDVCYVSGYRRHEMPVWGHIGTGLRYDGGLQFYALELEQDATVKQAYIWLPVTHWDIASDLQLRIYGVTDWDTDFGDSPPSQMTLTSNSVVWDIDAADFDSRPVDNTWARMAPTPDLSAIVNEITQTAGWGNSSRLMTFCFEVMNINSETNVIGMLSPFWKAYNAYDTYWEPMFFVHQNYYDCFARKETSCKMTDSSFNVFAMSTYPMEIRIRYSNQNINPDNWILTTNSQTFNSTYYTRGDGIRVYPIDLPVTGSIYPNTQYFWRMEYQPVGESTWYVGGTHAVHTQRADNATFKFAILADEHLSQIERFLSGRGPFQGDHYRQLAEQTFQNIVDANPDFVISLGDLHCRDQDYCCDVLTSIYSSIKDARFFDRVGLQFQYFAMGNHEGEFPRWTDKGWAGNPNFPSIAIAARQVISPNPDITGSSSFYNPHGSSNGASANGNYYAFEWGNALFIIVDSYAGMTLTNSFNPWNKTIGTTQYNFIYDTLSSSTKKWKFLFMHEMSGQNGPSTGVLSNYAHGGIEWIEEGICGFTSLDWGGEDGDGVNRMSTYRPDWTHGPIRTMLENNGATHVFHGHDHNHQSQQYNGISYIHCVHKGGTYWLYYPYEQFNHTDPGQDYQFGDWIEGNGFTLVTVSPNNVKCEVIGSMRTGDRPYARTTDTEEYGSSSSQGGGASYWPACHTTYWPGSWKDYDNKQVLFTTVRSDAGNVTYGQSFTDGGDISWTNFTASGFEGCSNWASSTKADGRLVITTSGTYAVSDVMALGTTSAMSVANMIGVTYTTGYGTPGTVQWRGSSSALPFEKDASSPSWLSAPVGSTTQTTWKWVQFRVGGGS